MTSEEAEAWDRLLFHLENQTGFWFALVVSDDARTRAQLREATQAWCSEHQQKFILHEPEPAELPALAIYLARAADPGLHWIRADGPSGTIEEWDTAATQLVLAMNERREAYRKRLQGGVIIEGRESLKRITRDLASDLFSIRAFIAEPGMKPPTADHEQLEWHLPASALLGDAPVDPSKALERAQSLEREAGPGAKKNRTLALLDAVTGFSLTNRPGEADRYLVAAAENAEELVAEFPDDPGVQHVSFLVRAVQGHFAFFKDDYGLALKGMNEAATIASSMTETGDHFVTVVVHVHKIRAYSLTKLDDHVGAIKAFRTLLENLSTHAERERDNGFLQLQILDTLHNLVMTYVEQDDLANAEQEARAAVARAEQNVVDASIHDRWEQKRVEANLTLGKILAAKGDFAASLESYRKALPITQEKAARHTTSEQWQILLKDQYQSLGSVLMAHGKQIDALATFQSELNVIERWLLLYPDKTKWQWWRAICLCNIAGLLLLQSNNKQADSTAARILDLIEPLSIRNTFEIQSAGFVARMQRRLYQGLLHTSEPARSRSSRLIALLERWAATAPENQSLKDTLAEFYKLRATTHEIESNGGRDVEEKR